jgi:hypothetical protein
MQAVGCSLILVLGLLGGTPQTVGAAGGTDTSYNVGVLVLSYFPLTPDGQNIDIGVTGDVGGSASAVRANVASMTSALSGLLSDGSKYRGYADPSAPPALTYQVVDQREFDTAVPSVPSTFNASYPRRADYPTILSSVNVCDYVKNRGVKEVWIWAYQGPHQLDISESKMSGPYGDISNSYRLNDMPQCGHTYTVYTFNYGRTVALAVHSVGHQLEAELAYMDPHLFNDLYEGPNHPGTLGVTGRCGSVHNPPNSRAEYDYVNPTPNNSDCNDWTPDGLGALTQVSCATWTCTDSGNDDPQLRYLIWWMQHFPGRGNQVTYGGAQMRNWWDVHGDFDAAVASGRRLTLGSSAPQPASLALAASANTITYGHPVSLSVKVPGGASRSIELDRSVDAAAWFAFATLATDSAGKASTTDRPATNTAYRAVFVGTTSAPPMSSATVRVKVRQTVSLQPASSTSTVHPGAVLLVTARVRPAPGSMAATVTFRVYRQVGASSQLVLTSTLAADASGVARIPVPFTKAGTWSVEAMAVATNANAASAWSAASRVVVVMGHAGPLPAAPGNVNAVALDASRIRVSWSESTAPISGFVVSDGHASITLPASSTTYTWGGRDPSTRACFRVYAFGPAGRSQRSSSACATTLGVSAIVVPALSSAGVVGPSVTAGQLVTITASGTWCMGGSGLTAECGGPGGIRPAHADEADVVLPSAELGTLIGKIGQGPLFSIGSSSSFRASASGSLRLLFNDRACCYVDNSESVTASISVEP